MRQQPRARHDHQAQLLKKPQGVSRRSGNPLTNAERNRCRQQISHRAVWLDEWCPTCRSAPGARCRVPYLSLSKTRSPTQLHVARGWRVRSCPTCKALRGKPRSTPSGRESSRVHQARLRPERHELLSGEAMWQELEVRRDDRHRRV
jgi:hypothetical protein